MQSTCFSASDLATPPAILAEGIHCTALGRGQTLAHQQVLLPEGTGYLLLSVMCGGLFGLVEEQPLTLSTGGLLVLPHGGTVSLTAQAETCQWQWLRVQGTQATALLGAMLQMGTPIFPQGNHCVQLALGAIYAGCAKGERVLATTLCAATYQLLTLLYGKNQKMQAGEYPSIVLEALQYMQQEFAHIYGVEDVARALEVSKAHLIRQFTASMGQSTGKYLTTLRIAHAKRLLAAEEMGLDMLAAASGFSSASYLCKVFRAETGLTPTEYRKTCAPHAAPAEIYL